MGSTTHSIDVQAPLRSVYDQWTQFEEFPRFMKDVLEVRQHGPEALSWKVLIGGKEKQWEARIIEQIPDTSIVWESVDGTGNRGAVTFESLGTDTTRLTVVMEYEPEGFLEKAGDILGVPSAQVEDSLKSFRELIESKSTATAGWRGRIDSADPEVTVNKDMAPEPATTSASGIGASTEAETYRQATPETETQAGEGEAGTTVPHPALQAVPVTHREAGAHEARTLAPVSAREEVSGTGPVVIKLNDLESETAKADRSEGFRSDTLWGPGKEEIARRAYELYLARGQGAGHEMDDWIEAERQLLEERNPES